MKFLGMALNALLSPLISRLPHRDAGTVLMLGAASAFAFFLLALRIAISGRIQHLFLPWNLLLAWLPLVSAVVSLRFAKNFGWRHWKPWTAAAVWLLFFPNAPYIFTDIVHLGPVHDTRFWIDLILILLFAWPGFFIGCVSLRMMQRTVERTTNTPLGWAFALTTCGLAGVGVYIGRFQRWNSWDVISNPIALASDVLNLLAFPVTHPAYRFSILFGALIFVGYATLQAQQLRPIRKLPLYLQRN